MVKKLNAGDRCQVESADKWIPATILTVYHGHAGAMVLPDDWATSVWAKADQIRPIQVNPSSAKRGDYTRDQEVEVQRSMGLWVAGSFDRWADETHERAYVYTGAFEPERYYYTNIRPAHVAPDPHDVAYQGEVGDHQPQEPPNPVINLAAIRPTMPTRFGKRRPNVVPFDSRRHQTEPTDFQKRMAYVGVEGDERDAYLEVILEFAKMGLTAEQIMPYVAVLGRIIVQGFTPDELDNNTTRALRARYAPPQANLHHISAEYRD